MNELESFSDYISDTPSVDVTGGERTMDDLNPIKLSYLEEVKDDSEAYSLRLEELGLVQRDDANDSNIERGDVLNGRDFIENFDDQLPPHEEICEKIEKGQELSLEELKEIRPDLAEYIENMQNRLGNNEYAQSIKAYYCKDGDIILAGKDDRSRQESNYAVVRGNDIYLWAGNARGDGHLNEFANNTDAYVPYAKYHFENATFVTNDKGQVTTVYEHHDSSRETDRNDARGELKSVSDAKGGLPNDVGGHIVAHNIDGPTEAINILPMNEDFNNSGEWKSMESELLKEYESGREFTVKKEIQYDPETGRPSHIDVTANIGGQDKHWSFDLP